MAITMRLELRGYYEFNQHLIFVTLHAQPNFAPGNRRVIGEPNIKLLYGYHPTMDSVHM
ncbi:hypothetical protein OH76DRAFT_1396689 [Lentinus brumalis]|uniref:Uncharacterized protein n=1 Tax=Lentinus brumalis TaxID=2498619 RepID=A0A371DS41_9APHY|nr:hypothetical protein OH76DRAFT_1396689 [Polyporus brumalis]